MDIAVSVSDKTTEEGIQGVSVTITDTTDNTSTFTGVTGPAGGCNLRNVTPGTYSVSATKEGYKSYNDELIVTEETSTLAIELEEE